MFLKKSVTVCVMFKPDHHLLVSPLSSSDVQV